MAEINKGAKSGKRKIHNTKVDLTPMVDLGFLLITFFVFTTTLSSNMAMNLVMPKDDQVGMPIAESGAVTIIPSKEKTWYYEGKTPINKEGMTAIPYANINTLRSHLLNLKRNLITANGDDKKLMVMIKPTNTATFSNTVDMLDEMKICGINRYALVDITVQEELLIAGNR